MMYRWNSGLWAIAALVAVTSAAAPQPLPASVHPNEDTSPSAPLEASPLTPAAIELLALLNCVNELARGQFAKGEAACSEAIALNPKNSNAYKLRGYGYLLEHRFERAEADFQASLLLESQDSESLAGYGQSLSGQGKFEAAVRQFTQAIALSPKATAYWSARCWARAGAGRELALALADCDQALVLSPATAGPLNYRGMVRLRMGSFQAAVADYSSSLAINPKQPSAMFGRGMALLNLGQREAAVIDIAQARQADPEIDDLFILMGVLPHDCVHPGNAICPPPIGPPQAKVARQG